MTFETKLRTLYAKLTRIEQIEPYSIDGDGDDDYQYEAMEGRRTTASHIADRMGRALLEEDLELSMRSVLGYVKRLRDEHICGSCNLSDWEREEIWAQKALAREIAVELEQILEPQGGLFAKTN